MQPEIPAEMNALLYSVSSVLDSGSRETPEQPDILLVQDST